MVIDQAHPEISKTEKKRLCGMIDCRKLSTEARANAIGNDQLPLRTIVQLLFIDQERVGGAGGSQGIPAISPLNEVSYAKVPQAEERKSRNGVEGGHYYTETVSGGRAEKTRVAPSPSDQKMEIERRKKPGGLENKYKPK